MPHFDVEAIYSQNGAPIRIQLDADGPEAVKQMLESMPIEINAVRPVLNRFQTDPGRPRSVESSYLTQPKQQRLGRKIAQHPVVGRVLNSGNLQDRPIFTIAMGVVAGWLLLIVVGGFLALPLAAVQ